MHTPEIINRILAPIRKRGLSISSLNYYQTTDNKATCTISITLNTQDNPKILKNMSRISDILSISNI
jgi:acetolactate synthase regulatory subunit